MEFLGKPETELASDSGKVNYESVLRIGNRELKYVRHFNLINLRKSNFTQLVVNMLYIRLLCDLKIQQ